MEHKYLNRNKKVSLSQVNFKEYFEFYKECVSPYLFEYILEDNTKLIVKFHEEHFSHLLGLHKLETFKKFKKMSELNNELLKNNISIKKVEMVERKRLKSVELRDRLTYFPVLRTLLDNATSVLKYDFNVIWNSKIEFSFLLHSNKIAILIYLAVKEIKGDSKICVPVSFLVDRNNKFSNMKLKEIKIKSKIIIKR